MNAALDVLDIWSVVFQFLSPADLVRAAKTCRMFRDLASSDEIWAPLCMKSCVQPADFPDQSAKETYRLAVHGWNENIYQHYRMKAAHDKGVRALEILADSMPVLFSAGDDGEIIS